MPSHYQVLPLLRRLIVGLLQQGYLHNSSFVRLEFVVNKVSSAKILHRELQVLPAGITPPLHHTRPFTSHQTCLFMPTDSVIKQHMFKAYLYEYNRMDSFLLFYFLPYSAFSNRILILYIYIYSNINVCNDDETEYFLIAVMTEIESPII
jgi:hypothetical protein